MAELTPRARVVIVEHDRVALIRRVRDGHTYYLFPGGGVEPGETPLEAARREAYEELGVNVELGPLVHEESFGAACAFSTTMPGSSAAASAPGAGPIDEALTAHERERNGTHEPVW